MSIIIAGTGDRVPHFVFLAHIVDVSSSMHVQFVLRSFSSLPYTTRLFLVIGWPFAFLFLLAMWVWSKTFLLSFYNLRGRLHQTWVVPRCGFQVGPYKSESCSHISFSTVNIYFSSFSSFFFAVFLAICYRGNQ